MLDTIICGDCLEVMPTIPDNSVDMVLADLPYKIHTEYKWNNNIDIRKLWDSWVRLTKKTSAVVLTAVQPFSSVLVLSCQELFKYELIWEKSRMSGFFNAARAPLRNYENILVFSRAPANYSKTNENMVYNPQKTKLAASSVSRYNYEFKKSMAKQYNKEVKPKKSDGMRHPDAIIRIPHDKHSTHPTQKPVALFEYLIRTYTNEGDTVLDPTCGSGTTAVACRKSNRHYICIEKELEYCTIAEKRIAEML